MPVTGSVSELLARASSRTEVRPADGKGGGRFERVLAGGERYFVKQLSPASDWVMRAAGDRPRRAMHLTVPACRPSGAGTSRPAGRRTGRSAGRRALYPHPGKPRRVGDLARIPGRRHRPLSWPVVTG